MSALRNARDPPLFQVRLLYVHSLSSFVKKVSSGVVCVCLGLSSLPVVGS